MFADLPTEEQIALVHHALHGLVGDEARRIDYLALLVASETAIQSFWHAIRYMPTHEQLYQAGHHPPDPHAESPGQAPPA